jgi:hypothetical protein
LIRRTLFTLISPAHEGPLCDLSDEDATLPPDLLPLIDYEDPGSKLGCPSLKVIIPKDPAVVKLRFERAAVSDEVDGPPIPDDKRLLFC